MSATTQTNSSSSSSGSNGNGNSTTTTTYPKKCSSSSSSASNPPPPSTTTNNHKRAREENHTTSITSTTNGVGTSASKKPATSSVSNSGNKKEVLPLPTNSGGGSIATANTTTTTTTIMVASAHTTHSNAITAAMRISGSRPLLVSDGLRFDEFNRLIIAGDRLMRSMSHKEFKALKTPDDARILARSSILKVIEQCGSQEEAKMMRRLVPILDAYLAVTTKNPNRSETAGLLVVDESSLPHNHYKEEVLLSVDFAASIQDLDETAEKISNLNDEPRETNNGGSGGQEEHNKEDNHHHGNNSSNSNNATEPLLLPPMHPLYIKCSTSFSKLELLRINLGLADEEKRKNIPIGDCHFNLLLLSVMTFSMPFFIEAQDKSSALSKIQSMNENAEAQLDQKLQTIIEDECRSILEAGEVARRDQAVVQAQHAQETALLTQANLLHAHSSERLNEEITYRRRVLGTPLPSSMNGMDEVQLTLNSLAAQVDAHIAQLRFENEQHGKALEELQSKIHGLEAQMARFQSEIAQADRLGTARSQYCDLVKRRLKTRAMAYVQRYLARYKRFAPWAGNPAAQLVPFLQRLMGMREVGLESRVALFLSMRAHFDEARMERTD